MNILDLPDELLLLIIKNLTVREAATACLACCRFHGVYKLDVLWKSFCKRDFGLSENNVFDGWPFMEFYQKVLFPFRFMFGWWERILLPFGGLYSVTVERDGIHCSECLPPLDGLFLGCRDIQQYFQLAKPTQPLSEQQLIRKYIQNSFDSDTSEKTASSDEDPETSGDLIKILASSQYSSASRYKRRLKRVFSLRNVGRELRIYCYQSFIGLEDCIGHRTCASCEALAGHNCQTACGERKFVSKTDRGFEIVCDNKIAHDTMNFNYWLELENGIHVSSSKMVEKLLASLFYFCHYHYRVKKFNGLVENCGRYTFRRLDFVPSEVTCPPYVEGRILLNAESETSVHTVLLNGPPVLPGVYFGMYSVHGWEIVNIKYVRAEGADKPRSDGEGWTLEGWKISGDQNVPAGKLSFRIPLDQPVYLPLPADQNGTQERINLAKTAGYKLPCTVAEWGSQEFDVFQMPTDFPHTNGRPKVCVGRFFGQGQVAGTNFHNPSWSPCMFSLFDDRSFALTWLELFSVAMFYRSDSQPCRNSSECS